MPGTPPTTPKLHIPRYASTDAADFPLQANAISDQLDLMAAGGVVTTLPTTGLQEGMEVMLQTASMGVANAIWRMRYAAALTTYKWWYVGGTPIYAYDDGAGTLGSPMAPWYDLGFAEWLNVDLPFAGIWDICLESELAIPTGSTMDVGVSIATVDPAYQERIESITAGTARHSLSFRKTITATGTVRPVYKAYGTGINFIKRRAMFLTPVRL